MPIQTMAKKKIRMTTAERIEIFRPNLMLSRLDNQENNFVQSAMFWVRQQAENLAIQYSQGIKPDNLNLNPLAVRNMAGALAASMIDTYALGEISYQNEYVQAEQIHQAKLAGTYQKNIVPFASASASASPFTPEVGLDWYKDYTLRLIGVHSVDALENTKNTVIKGIDEGLNQEQTISLIRNQFPTFSQHRLENIARTETAKIYEQARYQQMVDDEEVVGYEFFAIMDSRTSDICRSRDGKKIPKGQEQGWLPPLHYQCRSVLAPIFAWEDVQWDMAGTAVDALPGFGSTQMTIPESARNKIYIAGIPELRKAVKVTETPKPVKVTIPDWKTKEEAAQWMSKQFGIGSFQFEGGGQRWGAAFKKEIDQIAHMQLISEEWLRLQEIYPNMPKQRVLGRLWVTNTKRGGSLSEKGYPEMSVDGIPLPRHQAEAMAQWEKEHGVLYGVPRDGEYYQKDVFRHELGHILSRRNVDDWKELRKAIPYDTKKEWIAENISDYATTNFDETMAEVFTQITSRGYKPGTLPKDIEDWVENTILGGRAK